MIHRLISGWVLALIGSLLLPLVSVAAVSGTTYDMPSTTTTVPATIAECTVAVEAVSRCEIGLWSMGNAHAQSLFGLSGGLVAPKKPIVIGENMKRVQQYADDIGGHAYLPWKNDPFDYDLGMKRNTRWIKDMKRQGREIIDIGPDFKRRSLGRDPSDFYNMERMQTKDYFNYKKVFERTGKNSGGVPGLD